MNNKINQALYQATISSKCVIGFRHLVSEKTEKKDKLVSLLSLYIVFYLQYHRIKINTYCHYMSLSNLNADI